ncbi:hypothetical protein FACS1894182_06630 [Bacteroidia bacterium]|nr:hypothetical protein FACS1894182_06630 [Bacteroidia bacterium]
MNDRNKNLLLNNAEYEAGKIVLDSMPTVLFVELTQNCNSHCIMCYRAYKYPAYRKELDMKDEIFNLVKEQLFPTASIVDLRGIGESTLLKNFDKRLIETADTGVKIRLVTNALLIKQALWKQLMEIGASVVISVDATNPKLMKTLGRGDFNRLIQSLEMAVNEREKSGNKGKLSFNTVVSGMNLKEIEKIVFLAKKYQVDKILLIPVDTSYMAKSALSLDKKRNKYHSYRTKASQLAIETGVELRFCGEYFEDDLILEKRMNRCLRPWAYCYIDYQGNVGFCDMTMGNYIMGNIQIEPLHDIWNNERYRLLRSLHVNSGQGGSVDLECEYPPCNKCYKRRYIDFEDDINENLKSKIVSASDYPHDDGNKKGIINFFSRRKS